MRKHSELTSGVAARVPPPLRRAGKFLTFIVGQEVYAIAVQRIREIRRFEPVAAIPFAPGFLKGLVKFRGKVVPVVDLRLRLNSPLARDQRFAVMLFLTVADRVVCVVVDSVVAVVELSADRITRAVPQGRGAPHFDELISGMAEVTGQSVRFIALDAVVHEIEIALPGKLA